MVKLNLGWGNAVAVRHAFLETYNGQLIIFSHDKLMDFDYPTHEGDPELVEITRKVIERQVGRSYKHILLTNGATGGVVISLRAYAQNGVKFCVTREAPYYVRYPEMIKASGLSHLQDEKNWTGGIPSSKMVALLDIPSNPLGKTTDFRRGSEATVLDGVYLNQVYMSLAPSTLTPNHSVLVGSYSKLTGLNGVRIGWIATDDSILYERLKALVTSEYCGLSIADSDLLKKALYKFDWQKFESLARYKLDNNREEWSKLEKFFGDKEVGSNGMFYYSSIDQKCKELLEKSEISWTKGSDLGTDDNYGRFNLGQSNEIIKQAVKQIIKNDTIS